MVDIPADPSTPATIAIGGSVTDSLEVVNDHDWFRIQLTAGQQIVITLNGSGVNPLQDPYLYLRNSAGVVIASNDDSGGGTNSRIVFTVTQTGTYYIDVGAYEVYQGNTGTGTYTLSVNTFVPPPVGTLQDIANQLTHGYWNGDYHHFNVTQGGSLTVNLTGLTPEGQTLARAALALWTQVIGVNFVEVTTAAQITFDDDQEGAFANSTWSNHIISSSRVNVSTEWLANYGTTLTGYSFQTYIHEIGHALGLGHAGNYDGSADYPTDASYANEGWPTSIMSYFSQTENTYFQGLSYDRNYALTPMGADILAMQFLYGLSTTTRTGNDTYGPGWTTTQGVITLFDSSGIDTIDVSSLPGNSYIDLNPGAFSNVLGERGNIAIGPTTIIENARGGLGNDTLIGNSANNLLQGGGGNDTLYGNGGDDTLDGGTGADQMYGGTGNDVYYVDNSGDQVNELVGEGLDTVLSSISYTLPGNVENLQLTGSAAINGTGNALNNVLIGNSGANILSGGDGNDYIDGGAGDDQLFGGNGNDTLIGGSGSDSIDGGGGIDTLILAGVQADYVVFASGGGWRVVSSTDSDYVINVEQVNFGGAIISWADFLDHSLFDALRYVASNPDLIPVFGTDVNAAYQHYNFYGRAEGRSINSFDALRYAASNPDLVSVFGSDVEALTRHYIQSGYGEGRSTTSFDPLLYAASNPDLIPVFGHDAAALTAHYINAGISEGRPTASFNPLLYGASNPDLAAYFGSDAHALLVHYVDVGAGEGRPVATFDPWLYAASNPDLISQLPHDPAAFIAHYLDFGIDQQRPTTGFDALLYGASNPDLAQYFGSDTEALLQHYVNSGYAEGRPTATFDPLLYAASNTDLAMVFGTDVHAILEHYLDYGRAEGRPTTGFDAVAYLLGNPDLASAGLTADQALLHWLNSGADEGRSADGGFGHEQSLHALTVGGDLAGAFESGDNLDWYSIQLPGGSHYAIDLEGIGSGHGSLADGYLWIYDSTGHLIAFDDNSGPGNDATLTFTPPLDGLYYIVAGDHGAATASTYSIGIDLIP